MPSGKTFDHLTQEWSQTAVAGSLLTAKHDPNSLGQGYKAFRSVVTLELSSSLETFILSKNYSINEYYNKDHNNYYYTVKPNSSSDFKITGYEFLSGSLDIGSALDTLVLFSGSNQGWHVVAETSSIISQKISSGSLVFQGTI
jgi:hypothetical protein